jgi:hypothetical protein
MGPTIVPLDARIARLGLIHTGETGLKFRLGAVARSLNVLTKLADVVPEEATFDAYTAGGIAVTYTTGYIAPGEVPSNESQLISFIMNTAVTPNQVYYWWVDNGTHIVICGQFDTPVPMAAIGDALKVVVEDSYPPGLPAIQVVP